MNPRFKKAWGYLREQKLGDLVDKMREYADNVRHGADPIEAMSGHLCGPKCWHWNQIDEERKKILMKAPWNQPKKARR